MVPAWGSHDELEVGRRPGCVSRYHDRATGSCRIFGSWETRRVMNPGPRLSALEVLE